MAKLESPQIEILEDSAGEANIDESQVLAGEQISLLRPNKRKRYYCTCISGSRLSCNRIKLACCLKSKGILVILCWNTLLTLMLMPWLLTDTYSLIVATLQKSSVQNASLIAVPSFYVFQAILYLFYPLAGYLADIRCGRYRTIITSLWFIFSSGVFLALGATILACYLLLYTYVKTSVVTISLLSVGFGLPAAIGVVLLFMCFVSFKANVIQFGMDQLRDSPTEDSVLFIHWFVFSSFVGITVVRFLSIPFILHQASFRLLQVDFMKIFAGGFFCIHVAVLLILLVTLCLAQRRRQRPWFMTESVPDSRKINPYKLVYKAIKFAAQHKSPIRRSAFTYCEDELPSRMDLAKEKYGGPFTTEQVENVKVFLGILRILLTLGPFFGTHLFVSCTHPTKEKVSSPRSPLIIHLFSFRGVTDFLIMILIPLYICLLRPFIRRYIPGMLKRMGLGMALLVLVSICNLIVNTIGHAHHIHFPIYLHVCCLLFLHSLNAIGYTLFFIAAYEFICAQSPHAMKGLLIGTFFTVKGVFQLIGTMVLISLSRYLSKFETSFLSCGFVYSVINIVVAVIGLVAYTLVARSYQYRQRDEPDKTYIYAEEYYGGQG